MTRVLYLAYDLFSVGGIQRYSRHAVRALTDVYGADAVTTASLMPPRAGGFDGDFVAGVVGKGDLRAFSRELESHAAPTVVLCDHVALAAVGHRVATRAHAALCVSAHGIEIWGRLFPWRRRAVAHSDLALAVSRFTAAELVVRVPRLEGKVSVVHGCVDTSLFAPGEPTDGLREALELPDAPVLLTVSRLVRGRSKGHATVLRALAQLGREGHALSYVVAGDGDDRVRLERLAVDLGVDDRVRFVGRVADADLPGLYRLCDVFVLASGFRRGWHAEGEGLGLVALEAQACGKPVVASRLDGSAEAVAAGESGWVVHPDDPAELADVLRSFVTDPGDRSRFGNAARARAVESFSFDTFRDRLEQALRPLLAA